MANDSETPDPTSSPPRVAGMNTEMLYLSTIADLEATLAKREAYDTLRAAGLLRHLLVDGTSLVDAAARPYP